MIGVVGGGITGLALGWYLSKLGVDHAVFEASTRPGGVVQSHSLDGIPLEFGPQRTRMTREVEEVVDGLGLREETLFAPHDLPLFMYRKGRLRRVPLSRRAAVTTTLVSPAAKLRILAEPWTGWFEPEDTVESFFTRKFGREAYVALLGPLFGGLYGSHPSRMYVRHALARVIAHLGSRDQPSSLLLALLRGASKPRPPAVSFRDGMETLPRALAEANGANVRLGAEVTALYSRSDGGWSLEVDGALTEVDQIVMTAPANVSSRLLASAAPGVSARLGRLRYNQIGIVYLRGDRRLDAMGYEVALDEPMKTRGVTFNAALFGRDHLYTAYVGGMGHGDTISLSDEEMARIACRDFRTATGCVAEAVRVHRTRQAAWDLSWEALDDLVLPENLHLAGSFESRPGIPGRIKQAKMLAETLASRC